MKKVINILILVFVVCIGTAQAQTTYNASGTYTTGPAETCLRVQVWGAGGGGGGNNTAADGAGAGGGGGYSESFISVTPSTVYTVTVGIGGAGGIGNNAGVNGGQSFFISALTVQANGGFGGVNPLTGNAGNGGNGGATGIGSIVYSGGDGGNGSDSNNGRGGGGGSSAGTGANGVNGGNGTAGGGGLPGTGGIAPLGGGNGGNGGAADNNGNTGLTPGGGGGGSGSNEGAGARTGGAGANGRIIITTSSPVCPTATTIAPAGIQNICIGSATSVLTASTTTAGAGCTATVQYQWYSSLINSNTIATATLLPGQTLSTLTPQNLAASTLYYFCVSYAPSCAQTAATQALASNVVQVNIIAAPSVSAAGPDQSICIGSGATLAANLPGTGTGTWTVVSGPSTASAQFSSTANQAAIFTPAGGIGTYVLRWSITNAPCTASTDDISVTVTCGGGCPACSADYWQPTDAMAIANENVGNCLVTDCGPANFYDNGGPSANYAVGSIVGGTYRVFCPSIAGNCMTVTFNSFDTETTNDYLTIGNGPTQNSAFFTTPPANIAGRIFGTPATPFSYTSSHTSGCLTFRFRENGNGTQRPGWAAVLSCTPCAGGPTGLTNNDCINATALCSSAAVPSNSTGPGIVAEGCSGVVCPAGGENHTNWYWFQAATTGTLNVQVTPTTGTDDYDIAIFGPNVTCGALGSPIRCSDSGGTGTTGAVGTPGDLTEDVSGDKFVNQLNVIAGQSYYLMVDEWTPTGAGFTLSFGGSSASLDCVVLPIELADFTTVYNKEEKGADIYWKTDSQRDNDYFTIEKSTDGNNFYELASVDGAGTTNMPTEYFAFDPEIGLGVTYYRLKQTDFNGEFKYSVLRSINVLPEVNDVLTLFPNPTNGKTEVIFNTYQNEISYMTVTDSKGFVLLNKEIECKAGGNITEIDLTDNAHGIYFVTITTANKVYSSKLIKE